LHNLSAIDYQVKKGDRIAQIVIHSSITPPVLEAAELTETKRGSGGFGSTGK
jgi:dUTP pyrophosphatase